MAAAMLGRICLSGEVENLSAEQWDLIQKALTFYENSCNIIKYGITEIYGNRGKNMRYPTGTQAVVRSMDNEILVVVHSFENPSDTIEIPVLENAQIVDEFYNNGIIELKNGKLIINKMEEFSACAVILKK